MSRTEIDIIRRLSAKAAEPDYAFSKVLHRQLIERGQILKNNASPPKRRQFMSIKLISTGILGLVLVAGVAAVWLFEPGDNNQQTAQTPQNQSTSQSSALPSQAAESLDEAKRSLSFVPRLPADQIGAESLSGIKTGTSNGVLDDSDTLYLTYSDAQGTLYKISQSSQRLGYPEDAEPVTLEINGRRISAFYYRLANEDGGEAITSAGGDVAAPTSYLFWSDNGVNLEISEFGRVSRVQLIRIANSFVEA